MDTLRQFVQNSPYIFPFTPTSGDTTDALSSVVIWSGWGSTILASIVTLISILVAYQLYSQNRFESFLTEIEKDQHKIRGILIQMLEWVHEPGYSGIGNINNIWKNSCLVINDSISSCAINLKMVKSIRLIKFRILKEKEASLISVDTQMREVINTFNKWAHTIDHNLETINEYNDLRYKMYDKWNARFLRIDKPDPLPMPERLAKILIPGFRNDIIEFRYYTQAISDVSKELSDNKLILKKSFTQAPTVNKREGLQSVI